MNIIFLLGKVKRRVSQLKITFFVLLKDDLAENPVLLRDSLPCIQRNVSAGCLDSAGVELGTQ